jgi:hypothetical protein
MDMSSREGGRSLMRVSSRDARDEDGAAAREAAERNVP